LPHPHAAGTLGPARRIRSADTQPCPLCDRPTSGAELAEAGWISPEAHERLLREHPAWQRSDGACPACVQQLLLEGLLERGEEALHDGVQKAWPLDAEALGPLPSPLRLHAHPRYTGKGVTVAVVDAGFYPHPDLTRPRNRIRAFVDASREPVRVRRFGPEETPDWPGWDSGADWQWHGLMTSAVASGDGALSHGLYRGMASESDLVLVQVRDASGRIGNEAVSRALDWLRWAGADLGVRVVNLSLGGDPVSPLAGNPVDLAVAALAARGIVVVAAAGNEGQRRLVPPGTAPDAITIGGLDDRGLIDHESRRLWHSSYGDSSSGFPKPEIVAPSLWVVAPILPGTSLAREAGSLFERRASGDPTAEQRLNELKMVTPHYQHVEGTSFAAPLVSGTVACMLEANPTLTPRRVGELLVGSAQIVAGVDVERQGAGALDAGKAVLLALADRHPEWTDRARPPVVGSSTIDFELHEPQARRVAVVGSWDGWRQPGLAARLVDSGLWQASLPRPEAGTYQYKFVVDGNGWLADPANPRRAHDGSGGWNSVLVCES
jgi:serine protease AprX